MSYYFAKTLETTFDEAINRVTDALQDQGFGVLTEIDVQATFRKKLDADFQPYRILGACHPQYAYKALQAEDKIGTMLPCNVVVQDIGDGRIEVAAVDPIASMRAVENESLGGIATEIQGKLRAVIDAL